METLYLSAPFQSTVSIQYDDPEIAWVLRNQYGLYIRQDNRAADIAITVKKQGDAYDFITPHSRYVTVQPIQNIENYLFDHTQYDERIFAIHGAAVAWDGRAYLFAASTTSGKTTLASYLTTKGFGYITDDCILLERENFMVHPFTTPLHLRSGGVDILKKYGALPPSLVKVGENIRYIYTPEHCITKPLPLGRIYFINRTENENRLSNLTGAELMTALLQSPITIYEMNSGYLRFISKLAALPCKRLSYADMDYVAEVIKNG